MRVRALAKEIIYNTASQIGLTYVARAGLRGQVIILTYHSFTTNENGDQILNAMPIRRFETQVAFLQRCYEIISLSELLHFVQGHPMRKRNSTRPRVAITVDDGFADNYSLMFPVVRKYGIPATIFVVTDFVDTGRPPWPTEIAEIVKATSLNAINYPVRLKLRNKIAKQEAVSIIKKIWKDLKPNERLKHLDKFRKSLQVPDTMRIKPLTWDQIREMRRSSIEFGSHSVYHSILPAMAEEVVVQEVRESKRRLENELHEECGFFAYPNGDWDQATRRMVQEAGYRGAVTQDRGSNIPGSDAYCLKRIEVPYDESLGTFSCRSSLLAW